MSTARDAVAVTGIGIKSPLGCNLDAVQRSLEECRSCLSPLSLFDIDIQPAPTVCQITGALHVQNRKGFRYSRTDQLAILSARDAAGSIRDMTQCGVVLATTVGGLTAVRPAVASDPRGCYRGGDFSLLTSYQPGHVTDAVAADLGTAGPRCALSVACASGAIAISTGAQMLLDGSTSLVLAGGSDALCRFTLSGFNALQALDPDPCIPFDCERKGLNIGEGAAILAMEPLPAARERGAGVIAVLRGWGMSNDAYHPTAPHEGGAGLALCMERAMRKAGIGPNDVDFVNAHGTGTPLNDAAEAKAYERVFRDRREAIPVSSTKSYVGHNLAAAGAIEAVATIASLRSGLLFPTLRLKNPLDSNNVDWIKRQPRRTRPSVGMTVSAGFGGSNACLIFSLA
ncbi:MAG: beta-ketoacyl-[acyl-carrier-protein] synthase family protein [Acidobacteriota bacterium]